MRLLSVVGPGAADVVDAVAARLDGRVATVGLPATDGDPGSGPAVDGHARPDGVDAAYALAADGRWAASGTDRDFEGLLAALAPDYDYVLAAGRSRLRAPTVLLGPDRDPDDVPGDVLLAAADADAVDPGAVVERLADAEPHVTLPELVARAEQSPNAERAGAVATFTGRVRAKDAPDDDRTSHLTFEKYEGVAADRMDAIAAELRQREGVHDVLLHHRTGTIRAGEDIVFVVVLAGHRREAFRTVEDGIDRLKEEVPIFKKETTEAEEFWVHRRD